MSMTPDAKKALSSTIRQLRERMLVDLHSAVEKAYRVSVDIREAGLDERQTTRRRRLEEWLDEQVRAEKQSVKGGKSARGRADFQREAEKQAAYTLLNRVVFLRIMEARGIRTLRVVTGAWESPGYKDFRQISRALVHEDPTEGYATLLALIFEDLARDLPGLYGHAGIAELIPVPPSTLRVVVEALDQPLLASCWTDELTPGWVYQYWNDPEREDLDAKLNAGGKVEPHEIASKTQMFTERYMVDWLLQNSLGPMWLAMCQKNRWTPEVVSSGLLDALDSRRAAFRARREKGEVSLTELMPLYSDAERRWAWYVPQELPDDAVQQAASSVRNLKILDPAVGSGHFLVVAMDLLIALYREEARHRNEAGLPEWSDQAIVERILSHNLHGIDLDPRAVQIAAASLWLKAREVAKDARPERLNLVASRLKLASLPDDDPALAELRVQVEKETGIPAHVTNAIVHALKGADHLGSLLRVGAAVDEALDQHESEVHQQLALFEVRPEHQQVRVPFEREKARTDLEKRLTEFLTHHTAGEDLGLRLRGEQLAAGVRFVELVKEGEYDLVVGNPPYQGTSKMADAGYVQSVYRRGKADLYAAFLERGLQFVREGGVSALLTMRNWMFIKQYAELRKWLLESWDLRALGDFAIGAFDAVPNDVLSVVVSVFRRGVPADTTSVALQPTALDDRSYDRERTSRKRAAVLAGVGKHEFLVKALYVVPESPILYWWSREFLEAYAAAPKLGEEMKVRVGMTSGNNSRFARRPWEVQMRELKQKRQEMVWAPYVQGNEGRQWIEPMWEVLSYSNEGLSFKVAAECQYGSFSRQIRSPEVYFQQGLAFSMIGNSFSARHHRFPSVISNKGSSVYPEAIPDTLCLLNRSVSRSTLESLNPGLGFEVGDVNRLPLFPVANAEEIFATIEQAFTLHESHREPSVEFRQPGPSPWEHAQNWAQIAVDRPEGDPLPLYEPLLVQEPATDHLSFALGVALGRFGPNGEGILDPATSPLDHALPSGILFLDGTLDAQDRDDSLGTEAARPLIDAWTAHGARISTKREDLRDYLRLDFFAEVHRQMYENRPIHWPLSSSGRTFVAWVTIHRWTAHTLTTLLADHLRPAMVRIEGQLTDLREARQGKDRKAAGEADKRYTKVSRWAEELRQFMADVESCAEQGPPPADPKRCPLRARDARYVPDLDDGVMVNSAALWPLLEAQWKDPKKWWKELASAEGKDYDWSHLAMRYWPKRVDEKCRVDPSLGVAHGCFWRYHPARAWTWELRLQDEIGPEFRIEEGPYLHPESALSADHWELRRAFLREKPGLAVDVLADELKRRRRKHRPTLLDEIRTLEPGIWAGAPDQAWRHEIALMDHPYRPVRLRSPDDEVARESYLTGHPKEALEIVFDVLTRRWSRKVLAATGAWMLGSDLLHTGAPAEVRDAERRFGAWLSSREKSLEFRLLHSQDETLPLPEDLPFGAPEEDSPESIADEEEGE